MMEIQWKGSFMTLMLRKIQLFERNLSFFFFFLEVSFLFCTPLLSHHLCLSLVTHSTLRFEFKYLLKLLWFIFYRFLLRWTHPERKTRFRFREILPCRGTRPHGCSPYTPSEEHHIEFCQIKIVFSNFFPQVFDIVKT